MRPLYAPIPALESLYNGHVLPCMTARLKVLPGDYWAVIGSHNPGCNNQSIFTITSGGVIYYSEPLVRGVWCCSMGPG